MSVIETERRPRGRPQTRPDDETRHLIAEAAGAEFMANGYAGASMDAVAKGAGVSKKTLYRLVPTKADLFKAVVEDRIHGFLRAVDQKAIGALDIETGLERVLCEFGRLTLSDDTIAIQKLVIAESDRFPDLAMTFHAIAIPATQAAVEGFLRQHCAGGALAIDDPHEAAGMLRGMMIMEPQRAAMIGGQMCPTTAEIDARARACARLFLRGCRRDGLV